MTLRERIQSKIDGLEMSVEAEQGVVDALQKYRQMFEQHMKQPFGVRTENPRLAQRMRVLLDSEQSIRNWTEELADLRLLLTHAPTEEGFAWLKLETTELPEDVMRAVHAWASGKGYVGEMGKVSYVYEECARVVLDALNARR